MTEVPYLLFVKRNRDIYKVSVWEIQDQVFKTIKMIDDIVFMGDAFYKLDRNNKICIGPVQLWMWLVSQRERFISVSISMRDYANHAVIKCHFFGDWILAFNFP